MTLVGRRSRLSAVVSRRDRAGGPRRTLPDAGIAGRGRFRASFIELLYLDSLKSPSVILRAACRSSFCSASMASLRGAEPARRVGRNARGGRYRPGASSRRPAAMAALPHRRDQRRRDSQSAGRGRRSTRGSRIRKWPPDQRRRRPGRTPPEAISGCDRAMTASQIGDSRQCLGTAVDHDVIRLKRRVDSSSRAIEPFRWGRVRQTARGGRKPC